MRLSGSIKAPPEIRGYYFKIDFGSMAVSFSLATFSSIVLDIEELENWSQLGLKSQQNECDKVKDRS